VTDELGLPGFPSDNTTLTAVLHDYETAGFGAQFEVVSESVVRCVTCRQASAPSEFTMHATRRLEGASDPDDMLSVTAVSCPRCDARGTLVLGFGPNASGTEAMVGKSLRDQNDGRTIPTTPEPGE
jgi:hypothetical protein